MFKVYFNLSVILIVDFFGKMASHIWKTDTKAWLNIILVSILIKLSTFDTSCTQPCGDLRRCLDDVIRVELENNYWSKLSKSINGSMSFSIGVYLLKFITNFLTEIFHLLFLKVNQDFTFHLREDASRCFEGTCGVLAWLTASTIDSIYIAFFLCVFALRYSRRDIT